MTILRFCIDVIVSGWIAESKWSRWSPWSDCTKTCGTGARRRNRTCIAQNDPESEGVVTIPCAGKPVQIDSCAAWNCPGRFILHSTLVT